MNCLEHNTECRQSADVTMTVIMLMMDSTLPLPLLVRITHFTVSDLDDSGTRTVTVISFPPSIYQFYMWGSHEDWEAVTGRGNTPYQSSKPWYRYFSITLSCSCKNKYKAPKHQISYPLREETELSNPDHAGSIRARTLLLGRQSTGS